MHDQSSETRVCRKCGEAKALPLFSRGHQAAFCKACMARYERERQARHRVPKPPKERPTEKRCLTCEAVKPISAFHRSQVHKGVEYHAARCRACTAIKRNAEYVHKPSRKLDPATKERRCYRCGQTKPIASFPPDPRMTMGRAYRCHACNSAQVKARRLANPEKARAAANARYALNRDAILDRSRSYRQQHRLKLTVQRGALYDRRPEPAKQRVRRWQLAHPEKVAAHRAKRRKLKAAAGPARLTAREWRETIMLFDQRCAYCWRRLTRVSLDHVIPLSRGGSHTSDNAVPSCSRCNHRKYDRTLLEYLLLRNLLPLTK